jgi:hypothetical protein
MSHLTPCGVKGHSKIRVGGDFDGGYVMVDDLAGIDLCLSLGVGPEVTWDYEMAKLGAKIVQYDHTVDGPPVQHENFVFHKTEIGVSDSVEANTTTIGSILRKYGKGAEKIILQMDIEGAEWDVLDAQPVEVLASFDQILLEFHSLNKLYHSEFFAKAERVLSKLSRAAFSCHIHGNNFSRPIAVSGVVFPEVLEASFANRKKYVPIPSTERFPSALDAPNDPERDDFYLGDFRFI